MLRYTSIRLPLTISDCEQCRHWSARSQPFASGDQLMRFLYEGWRIQGPVRQESYPLRSGCYTVVYTFHVINAAGRQVAMRILDSPFVQQVARLAREQLSQPLRSEHRPARVSAYVERKPRVSAVAGAFR